MADGQCLCGAVKYEVRGSLGEVRYCHCSRCRRATGSAFSANTRVHANDFRVLVGRSSIREYEENPGVFRAFCAVCGSPIYARLDREPEYVRIRLGGFSGDIDVRVTSHVWVSSRASWHQIDDSLPRYPEAAPRGTKEG
jgi:hypothetical protein